MTNKISAVLLWAVLTAFLLPACARENQPPTDSSRLLRGADLSFLPELESKGVKYYYADGQQGDALAIMADAGCNVVRVRLWHTPVSVHSSLAEVQALAARIRAKGMKFWLDIHYSDTWADPGKQGIPAAWKNLNLTVLADSVRAYTQRVVGLLQPDIVQIGNEINGGFLWDIGYIDHQDNFVQLLNAGIAGARAGKADTEVMIHYAGFEGAHWFFNLLKDKQVNYDIPAISYYPEWHGKKLDALESALIELETLTGKDIVIAETAYPFSLDGDDSTGNFIWQSSQLVTGIDATPEGQLLFLQKLREILSRIPNNHGRGFCYWGTEWVAVAAGTSPEGSIWENQALFNFANKAVKAMEGYKP